MITFPCLIADTYTEHISNKDAKYDRVLEKLQGLTEQVTKTIRDCDTCNFIEIKTVGYVYWIDKPNNIFY
jgi:hypothetical protein